MARFFAARRRGGLAECAELLPSTLHGLSLAGDQPGERVGQAEARGRKGNKVILCSLSLFLAPDLIPNTANVSHMALFHSPPSTMR